jgi:hypothetical protein
MVATIFSNSASALSKVGDFEALLITCRTLKRVKIPHIAVSGQSPRGFRPLGMDGKRLSPLTSSLTENPG